MPVSSFLLIVSTNSALRARTKASQCGVSALNIMNLRGCSSSYREGLFLVCSHVKCHLEVDKIWRSNSLWKLHWTAHFLILFSCYSQALLGDPCHCAIKLIIFHWNYCWHCSLEVRITGSLLILLNWLYDVNGQEFAYCCNSLCWAAITDFRFQFVNSFHKKQTISPVNFCLAIDPVLLLQVC